MPKFEKIALYFDIEDQGLKAGMRAFISALGFDATSNSLNASICLSDGRVTEDCNIPVIRLSLEKNGNGTFLLPARAGTLADKIRTLHAGRTSDLPEEIKLGAFILHPRLSELRNDDDKIITLTEKERDLLLFLYKAENHFADRTTLLRELWGYVDGIETHTLETHIYRIRQKIEKSSADPQFLKTKDDGYYLNI